MTKLLLAIQETEAVAPLTDASVLPGNFKRFLFSSGQATKEIPFSFFDSAPIIVGDCGG